MLWTTIGSHRRRDGQLERAGLVWGSIEAEEGRSPMGAWAKERDRLGAPVLVHDVPDFQHGREQGRLLSFDEGVDAALAGAPT